MFLKRLEKKRHEEAVLIIHSQLTIRIGSMRDRIMYSACWPLRFESKQITSFSELAEWETIHRLPSDGGFRLWNWTSHGLRGNHVRSKDSSLNQISEIAVDYHFHPLRTT